MRTIWKREMQSYFHTPIGYVYMGIFLLISSMLFFLQIMKQRSGDLLSFIGMMGYLWMLLSPVLTMRLMAEERSRKTDQLLLTSPVSLPGIILGKYLAAVCVMLLTVAATLVFVLIVAIYGTIYLPELLVGYLGFILEGCAFIAIDLLMSELAHTPVIAAVMAFGANFILWMLDLLSMQVSPAWLSSVLDFISIYGRNEPFLMGQLSFASIMFDLTIIAIFLVLSVFHLDSRRYRGA